MSTHAAIGMKQPDVSVKAIYLHFDGYVAGAGAILAGWCTNTAKVEALLPWENLAKFARNRPTALHTTVTGARS